MIDFALGFATALLIQYIISKIYVHMLEKKLEEKIDSTLNELRKKIIPSRIEIEKGIFYMYNRDTNEFLVQANSFDELEKAAKRKYPDKLFNVPQSELMEIMKVDETK